MSLPKNTSSNIMLLMIAIICLLYILVQITRARKNESSKLLICSKLLNTIEQVMIRRWLTDILCLLRVSMIIHLLIH